MKPKSQTSTSQSDQSATTAANAQATVAEAKQAQAVDVLAVDEHAGKPGSYVFDPATGKRSAAA